MPGMIGAPKPTRLAKVIKWTNLKVITFKNFIWLKIANTYGRSLEKGFRWALQSFLFVMTAPMETD
ncbi:MAG TPA: hypothetical protein DDY76_07335 [Opitutae bacterium]|nr:hypothetical protein [Opitutae bacterium]|tara:strand:+ start:227 stop:424 length:198 start_codon:yes stop_codon:yes gene_type:complete